jgi:hypothetical protein
METRRTYTKNGISFGSSSAVPARARPTSRAKLLKGILAAALGIAVEFGVRASAHTETTVNAADYASGPAQFQAIQNAVNNFDIVSLRGTFDLPAAIGTPLRIRRDVTLRGEKTVGDFDLTGENLVDQRS